MEEELELAQIIGTKHAAVVKAAIKNGSPIMIFDRTADGTTDGILYRLLKSLGAKEVYNYDVYREMHAKVNGVFCTVFVN